MTGISLTYTFRSIILRFETSEDYGWKDSYKKVLLFDRENSILYGHHFLRPRKIISLTSVRSREAITIKSYIFCSLFFYKTEYQGFVIIIS
jgi:hypothetical protein